MHAVFKLSSILLRKEFLLHKNQKVFSGPMRIFNLFTNGLSTPVAVSKNLQSAKLQAVERPLVNRLKILMGPEKILFDFCEAEILF